MNLFIPIVIFYPCMIAFHLLLNTIGPSNDPGSIGLLLVFGAATWIAVYPKIKKEKRTFTISEKLIFTALTWGPYVALGSSRIFSTDVQPTAPGLMILGFYFFGAFCGIWLVISTFANKFFEKQLA